MWPWDACWLQEGWQTAKRLVWRVLKVWTVLGRPNGRLGRPEEAIDVWPWGAGQTADLDAHKKPMCGPGIPVGCKRAGKRLSVWRLWRVLMCGPGVPVGCKSGHKKPLMCGLGVAVGCKSGHKKRLMCGAGWLLAAGVAVGCRVKHAKSTFEGFYGF